MPSEYDFFTRRRSDRIYISKAFDSAAGNMRILTAVFDPEESAQFVKIEAELALRITEGERQQVKIYFYEDSRNIDHIIIQRFNLRNGNPHEMRFTFTGEEIEKLYNLLHFIHHVALPDRDRAR